MPRPEYLADYYSEYYVGKSQKVSFAVPERFARHIVKRASISTHLDRVRILDFGGGDGTLAKAIAERLLLDNSEREVQVVVADFTSPGEFGDKRISVSHVSSHEQIVGEYELVLASAILEHIPDVNPVFHALFKSVARGGYFYARTPYVVPFAKFIPNLDITYPAHVHDMGSSFWNRVVGIFEFPGRSVVSQPSLVESTMREFPLRTLAAYLLKLPAYCENAVVGGRTIDRFWNFVGGWEVVLQRSE